MCDRQLHFIIFPISINVRERVRWWLFVVAKATPRDKLVRLSRDYMVGLEGDHLWSLTATRTKTQPHLRMPIMNCSSSVCHAGHTQKRQRAGPCSRSPVLDTISFSPAKAKSHANAVAMKRMCWTASTSLAEKCKDHQNLLLINRSTGTPGAGTGGSWMSELQRSYMESTGWGASDGQLVKQIASYKVLVSSPLRLPAAMATKMHGRRTLSLCIWCG